MLTVYRMEHFEIFQAFHLQVCCLNDIDLYRFQDRDRDHFRSWLFLVHMIGPGSGPGPGPDT